MFDATEDLVHISTSDSTSAVVTHCGTGDCHCQLSPPLDVVKNIAVQINKIKLLKIYESLLIHPLK
jgi:hypothetical protein